jgi:hypothetical protein
MVAVTTRNLARMTPCYTTIWELTLAEIGGTRLGRGTIW